MNIAGKLNAEWSHFARQVKNSTENCKLDGKITEQEKKIKGLTKEIGNLVLIRLEAGDEMSPEIMERYNAILEAKTTIEELQKERKTTKIICLSCGTKTSVNMKYCGKCGTKLTEE